MSKALGRLAEEGEHLVSSPVDVQRDFEDATSCSHRLLDALERQWLSSPAPSELVDEAKQLADVVHLVPFNIVKHKKYDVDALKREITTVAQTKRRIVMKWFTQELFGIPGSESILAIDCVSSNLGEAYGIASQAATHRFTSKLRAELFKLLGAARRCKESLEATLRKVGAGSTGATSSTGVSTEIRTTVGPVTIREGS